MLKPPLPVRRGGICTHTHTHTHSLTHTHIHIHTLTHSLTHTHTYLLTHTHTHTHTVKLYRFIVKTIMGSKVNAFRNTIYFGQFQATNDDIFSN